jgi:Extensin-like protein C-terminus
MRTRVAYGLITVALCAFLTGCGKLDFGGRREPWRDAAELRCLRDGGLTASAFAEPLPPIDQKFGCGLEHPFKVSGLSNGDVTIQPGARIGCPMNVALNKWVREVVQPAAMANYGQPITGIKNIASYGCRTRNNKKGAKLSEHSFGNALDIKAFYLADGREIDVRSHWHKGSPQDRNFLRAAHGGACGTFKTVLGPGSDGYHEDHFHLDLARHDAAGERAYCRPLPQKVPNMPPPRYLPQPHYYPPEVSQAPGYPPQQYPQQGYPQQQYPQQGYQPGYQQAYPQQIYPQQQPQNSYSYPEQAYPPQDQPIQRGYDPYAVGSPMSFAPKQWPIARVPTPYTDSVEGAYDQ